MYSQTDPAITLLYVPTSTCIFISFKLNHNIFLPMNETNMNTSDPRNDDAVDLCARVALRWQCVVYWCGTYASSAHVLS